MTKPWVGSCFFCFAVVLHMYIYINFTVGMFSFSNIGFYP